MDRDLEHPEASHLEERGDEAVKPLVEHEVRQALAPEGAEGAPAVLDGLVAQGIAQPVGDARGDAAHHRVTLPAVHPPARHGVPPVQVSEHRRDVVGIVLEIRVHHDHVAAAGRLEAGVGGRRLARIGLEPDEPHARVLLAELADDLRAPILAAVVHEDHLVAQRRGGHHLADLGPQQGQIVFLVVHGHDDGQVWRGRHGRIQAWAVSHQPRSGDGPGGGADAGVPCHSGTSR